MLVQHRITRRSSVYIVPSAHVAFRAVGGGGLLKPYNSFIAYMGVTGLGITRVNPEDRLMENLSVDRSYTGGVMQLVGLMEARYEHIPQTNMESVNYYHIDAP